MTRLRTHSRPAVLLALFALALQLVVGATHFHPEDFGRSAAQAAAALGRHGADPGAPGRPADHHPGHDACAICATVGLTSAPLLASPPIVAALVLTSFTWAFYDLARTVPGRRAGLFRARAPPV